MKTTEGTQRETEKTAGSHQNLRNPAVNRTLTILFRCATIRLRGKSSSNTGNTKASARTRSTQVLTVGPDPGMERFVHVRPGVLLEGLKLQLTRKGFNTQAKFCCVARFRAPSCSQTLSEAGIRLRSRHAAVLAANVRTSFSSSSRTLRSEAR